MQKRTDREVPQRVRPHDDLDYTNDGRQFRVSGEYELVENRWMPTWFEFITDGLDGPDMHVRIEVRDGMPLLVELSWLSRPGQREVKQKDLRDIRVSAIVEDLYSEFVYHIDPATGEFHAPNWQDPETGEFPAYAAIRRFVEQQRRPPGHREINQELLRRVAEVYRQNFDRAPTKAVGRVFGVKGRMASTYVQKAREHGFLPQTEQGKKKA